MGFDVKTTAGSPIELETAVRRGLAEAGKAVLAASIPLVPREPVARHGVHLADTGFVRVEPGLDEDAVMIGFGLFTAAWQHERLDYDHPYGGEPKFLEIPLLASEATTMEIVAGSVRRVFE